MTGKYDGSEIIENGIRANGWSTLHIEHLDDSQVGDFTFSIYWATISTGEGGVFDAWIIEGLGITDICNSTSYPTLVEALCYHIGNLVSSGICKIVRVLDETNI